MKTLNLRVRFKGFGESPECICNWMQLEGFCAPLPKYSPRYSDQNRNVRWPRNVLWRQRAETN